MTDETGRSWGSAGAARRVNGLLEATGQAPGVLCYDISMIILVLILLGLCFGSFVNALVWRLHEGRDIVREHSECPHCHHLLAPKDLVPVFSWLWLRGRCRYCHKRFDDTPLAELLVPLVFVLSYIYWPWTLHGDGLFRFVIWLMCVIGFVALTLYDFKWFMLPDKIVFTLIGLVGAQALVSWLVFRTGTSVVVGELVGAVLIAGLFYLVYLLSAGKWIGLGDVKLGIALGLLAGGAMQAMLLLFTASLAGTIATLPMLITGKAGRKTHIPFGPFLLLATVVVQLWAPAIITWYTQGVLSL